MHFFVEHQFCVLISIDGDKKSHDNNRIFRDTGLGTFDTIEKNIKRFIELYPKYEKRGIIMTLTADNNFFMSNSFIRSYRQYYPALVVNFVDDEIGIDAKSNQYFSHSSLCKIDQCESQKTLPFFDWTAVRQESFVECLDQFYSQLSQSVEKAKNDWPIFGELFVGTYRQIHNRTIKKRLQLSVTCGCIPEAVRLYCNTYGNYYPCEKVETSDILCIGNVWSGIDTEKVYGLIEYLGNIADCNNCVGKFLCAICPISITEGKNHSMSPVLVNRKCEYTLNRVHVYLQKYTDIMETMPSLLDNIYSDMSHGDDWLEDVYFLVSPHQHFHNCSICKK
ncbi:MAG: hypothetical protein LBJ67_06005 [Planctomycetaceae bacterium]|jgi:uncharacterized protein|nr:hypothetical protein [Planctomycetaceae bacterium]